MRKTYVMRSGKLVPLITARSTSFHLMPDLKPFTTQDGKEITSRSGLRAYEQANGVKQVGNDYSTLHKELRNKVHGEL